MIALIRGPVSFAARWWQRLLDAFHGCRWKQVEQERRRELLSYRRPIQVCPRGCEHHEPARRDLITRTALWGRVETRVVSTFEADNCPKCGAGLVRECARCKSKVHAPVIDRCRFCGLPQPWAAARRAAAERAGMRKWRAEEGGVTEAGRMLYEAGNGRELWVIEGDITRLEVDAVISNVDVDGQMWSEVAGAIRSAAGEEVEQRAGDGRPYKLGRAWATTSGSMAPKVKRIIHVASMDRRGRSSLAIVKECLSEALKVAVEEGLESVAVGAFGSGPKAIPQRAWLETFVGEMIPLLTGRLALGSRKDPLAIILVLWEPEDFSRSCEFLARLVEEEYRRLGEPIWANPVSLASA
jgi:O-acetyl-ADP-ribose deacetylase (regulator of RNase III)/predicted RNA-binding Zn-ribbon protein involved in translation (DUF1610 family)